MTATMRSVLTAADSAVHRTVVHVAELITGREQARAAVAGPHRHAGAADPTNPIGWDPPDQRVVGDVSGNDRAGGQPNRA
jgi:hypothetical protein